MLPAVPTGENLTRVLIRAGVEFGHVSHALLEALDPDGPGGHRITAAENDRIDREVQKAVQVYTQFRQALRSGSE